MDRVTAAEVFVAIVERGSMIGAADALEMSRAMVTRYLAQMEQWAGARLLHRTTRKLSLTHAGEATLERCRRMLEFAQDMDLIEGQENDELRGLLRISCSQSLGQSALVIAVTEYLRRYPQVAVDLQMNNRAVNLVEERIDLALRITNELDPNLIARPLATCHSVVCAAPAYLLAKGTPKTPSDLAVHNCLTYSYFGKSLWHFDQQGVQSSVAVGGNLSANESVVLLSGALEGAGITLQPSYSAAPHIARGELIKLLPDYQPQAMGIYGIYTSRRQMPGTLRAMLDYLVEWFATHPLP
ncbi:bacterial regulatory helix-turn-helix, lysR family protein [Yersinia rohdei]|uniref:Bacterial regulatory helix-turn-helix, lysR family protein n=1 Tax=Yersinia rohdei TaxID=29485 RepID=A0A0U1HWT6_YERRO|nr:LysR family transcriptional regulator [Yersinia rohdei]AJJ11644.1 bacterial regulatory helix-turn-helix, lysR family protein [Yersinia rohdei]EEQ01492.1 Regulatory protein, LysR:LysR, substrate-binding [Yersinia rohdei ATCC 43380]MDN0096759.1 LysR family transcriptional regulator [Yersinia rohdei]OWF77509.1 LysR family transcriptional regulator [Yersinia rohdei]CNE88467.1 LysR family transcriptional regulator [Yersinia rohdei]